jgi:hypothetical protein
MGHYTDACGWHFPEHIDNVLRSIIVGGELARAAPGVRAAGKTLRLWDFLLPTRAAARYTSQAYRGIGGGFWELSLDGRWRFIVHHIGRAVRAVQCGWFRVWWSDAPGRQSLRPMQHWNSDIEQKRPDEIEQDDKEQDPEPPMCP